MPRWTFFRGGTKIDPNEVNANFQQIRLGTTLPRANTLTMASTNSVFNLGSDTVRWTSLYANGLDIASTSAFALLNAPSIGQVTGEMFFRNRYAIGFNHTNTTGDSLRNTGRLTTGARLYLRYGKINWDASTSVSDPYVHGVSDIEANLVSAWFVHINNANVRPTTSANTMQFNIITAGTANTYVLQVNDSAATITMPSFPNSIRSATEQFWIFLETLV